MRKLVIILVVLGLVNVAGAAYVETFNANNAGWLAVTVNDGGGNISPAATWNNVGGNPGRYISGTLNNVPDRLFGLQAADASLYQNLIGLTLTTDYKIDGTVTGPEGAQVKFYIGTYLILIWKGEIT
jgi:uncharacterized membrane protein